MTTLAGLGVELRDVHFRYVRDVPVLRGVDFSVRRGEVAALLGSNGAGKTTLFRLIAGLARPDSGSIQVAGLNVSAASRETRRRCGFVPDEPLLYRQLSASENLCMVAILWGVAAGTARSRAEELLLEVGLWEVRDQLVASYSRGMTQKLAICAALLPAPEVLLMDEPFTGLDLESSLWARAVIRRFADAGGTVLFTTHLPELVDALAERVAFLHTGRIAHVAETRTAGPTLDLVRRYLAAS
jgi:ABC-2 type transport system ATP-binding protein